MGLSEKNPRRVIIPRNCWFTSRRIIESIDPGPIHCKGQEKLPLELTGYGRYTRIDAATVFEAKREIR